MTRPSIVPRCPHDVALSERCRRCDAALQGAWPVTVGWADGVRPEASYYRLSTPVDAVVEALSASITDALREHTYQAANDAHEFVERACEEAIQSGDRGVLLLTSGPGGPVVAGGADRRVPYGQLWYVPIGVDIDVIVAREAARRDHPAAGGDA